jgi:ribosome maturation factor RimP
MYTLEVESAGIDRPLFKPADYERFTGNNVRVVTTLPIASHKTFRGRLEGVRGTSVVLTTETGELPIPLDIIKSANIEFDIRADLSRAKREKKKGKS